MRRVGLDARQWPPMAICELGAAGLQEGTGLGGLISQPSSFKIGHAWGGFNTGKMVPLCRLPQRGLRKRSNGSWPSSFCTGAMQVSLSLYVPCIFRAIDPPLEPRGSISKRVCAPAF